MIVSSDPFEGFSDRILARLKHVRLVLSNEPVSNHQDIAAFIKLLANLTTSLTTITLLFLVSVTPLGQQWLKIRSRKQEALMCQLPNSKLVKDAISSLHPSAKIQIGLTNDDGAAGFKEVTDLVNYVVAQKKWRVTTQWVAHQFRTTSEWWETLKMFGPKAVAEEIVLLDTGEYKSVVHHDWTWTLTPASA